MEEFCRKAAANNDSGEETETLLRYSACGRATLISAKSRIRTLWVQRPYPGAWFS
jgi:hypothetical protein